MKTLFAIMAWPSISLDSSSGGAGEWTTYRRLYIRNHWTPILIHKWRHLHPRTGRPMRNTQPEPSDHVERLSERMSYPIGAATAPEPLPPGRTQGQRSMAIRFSAETGRPIMCADTTAARQIRQQAERMGMDIPEPHIGFRSDA